MKRLYVKRSLVLLLVVAIGFGGVSACSTLSDISGQQNSLSTETAQLIVAGDETVFSGLVEQVSGSRVIYFGETHDRYDHHLNQLAVIKGLYNRMSTSRSGLNSSSGPCSNTLTNTSRERSVKKSC